MTKINLLSLPTLDNTYQNTIDFTNISGQNQWFTNKVRKTVDGNFKADTELETLALNTTYTEIKKYDYLFFTDADGKRLYYFIMNKKYNTASTSEVTLELDVLQTYMFDYKFMDSFVDRMHVDRWKTDETGTIKPTEEYVDEGFTVNPTTISPVYSYSIGRYQNNYIITSTTPLGKLEGGGGGGNDNPTDTTIQNGMGSFTPPATGRVTALYPAYPSGGYHSGIDIANELNTPIYAMESGTVTYAGADNTGFGNKIIIKHRDVNGIPLTSLYAHMYTDGIGVITGQEVTKGQTIAKMGSAGNSTGNHVHFEFRANGDLINPATNLKLGQTISLKKTTREVIVNDTELTKPLLYENVIIPQQLYYYLLDEKQIMSGRGYNIPPISAIQSVTYAPFLNVNAFELWDVQYDAKRFEETALSVVGENTVLKRIIGYKQGSLNPDILNRIGDIENYKQVENANLGKVKRDFTQESKLLQSPYTKVSLYSTVTGGIDYKPQLLSEASTPIYVQSPLTNTGTFSIFAYWYNGDKENSFEKTVINTPPSLPLVTNAYTDYMTQNKASLQANKNMSYLQSGAGLIGAGVAGATAIATGGGSLLVGGALLGGASALSNAFETVTKSIATERDLSNTSNMQSSTGNDGMFDIQTTYGDVKYYYVSLEQTLLNKIGDYFAMYGYKQSKLITPNIRNRYYYNFLKTSECNITNSNNSAIPKEDFNRIKTIYNNGVSTWHIDRTGVNVGDYSMNNYEV